jgi:hypothetical protein
MAGAEVLEFELAMIPRSIRSNLASLRRRERLIALVWGVARFLTVVLSLLVLCALTDYLIDRDRDTPWTIRYLLFGMQAAAVVFGAVYFIVWPQLRRLRDPELALWVESRTSRLEHRLITAVELNQPGAQIEGMSEELIGVVTREAEKMSKGIAFPHIADHGRLTWAAAVLVPVVLVALVPLALWPGLTLALLGRQALQDIEVPRLVHLDSHTPQVWPIGEKMALEYRVAGPVTEESVGEVIVTPEGQRREAYPLTFKKQIKDGEALFGVDLPAATIDFTYSARLSDGRTRTPGQVRFVPRPVVQKQEAWVQLPAYCGLNPQGQRYELPQGHGDIVGIAGSKVRVWLETQKVIKGGTLEILGPAAEAKKSDDEPSAEVVKGTVKLNVDATGQEAEAVFDLDPGATGYRMVVWDEHGFVNVPAPRRSMRIVPEEPPQVLLLKDYFGGDADSDVEGIPVPLGKAIRIPYVCHGAFGLGMARILYRVVPKIESSDKVVEPGPWTFLPLPEVTGTEKLGRFDLKRGVFENSEVFDEVPFYAAPSHDANVLGRQLGGGRFFLQTKGLIDAKGKALELKKGDQIEYCVEVFAERFPHADRATAPSARSETRVTTVVDASEWRDWLRAVLREEEQLRKLDADQRGVFDPK